MADNATTINYITIENDVLCKFVIENTSNRAKEVLGIFIDTDGTVKMDLQYHEWFCRTFEAIKEISDDKITPSGYLDFE